MRRASLVLVALGGLMLAGCDALRDAFSPRAETVARANDQTLSVNQLVDWASAGKQVPLDPLSLSRLAHVWVDYALFAQTVASGRNLRDSATVTAAMWPVLSQLKWERFHDRLAQRKSLTPQEVDSIYQAGDVRMFQHILFQVPPSAAPAVDQKKHDQANAILAQAKTAGPRFAQLATRYSDDPGSKAQGGSLGLSTRGMFVQAFDDAAWQLQPGGVSGVVKSPFGYHIIRRPPLAEVRDSFRTAVEDRLMVHGDSLYVDSLAIKKHIEVAGRAPSYVRSAVQDLEDARSSNRVLVDWRGGALRTRDLVRWLAALDPQVMEALPQATDDQIDQFLRAISQRQILLDQADSARVGLTADDWKEVRAEYDSALTLLGNILSLTPQVMRDSGPPTAAGRETFAMARVDDYIGRVLQGRARFFPVPPFLAQAMRGRARWTVDEAGVRRAIERVQQIRADSTRARNAPHMTPAPGPAPIDTSHRRQTGTRTAS